MALSKKKQEAFDRYIDSLEKLYAYRGIPCNICRDAFDTSCTVRRFESMTEANLKACEEPLPEPTEKQLSFIMTLLDKDYNSDYKKAYLMALAYGKGINRYQASEFISMLKTEEDMIYRWMHATKEDFDRHAEEVHAFIKMFS